MIDWVYGIGLVVLGGLVVYCLVAMRRFTENTTQAAVHKQLKSLEAALETLGNQHQATAKSLSALTNQSLTHLSRVGFVRFNPFDHTGGEHSFTLALLDSHECGIVITSLHARQQTRVYAQVVERGKPQKNAVFSQEEQEAIKQARRSASL